MILFMTITALLPMKARATGQDGNGGDPQELEFRDAANDAISRVTADRANFPELANLNLMATLKSTLIKPTNEPLSAIANIGVDDPAAINFKNPNIIYLNRPRWQGILRSEIRQALALHELLGLVGLERTGVYTISERYLELSGIHCKQLICASIPNYHCSLVLNPSSDPTSVAKVDFGGGLNSAHGELSYEDSLVAAINVTYYPGSASFSIQIFRAGKRMYSSSLPDFPPKLDLAWNETSDREWGLYCVKH
jgi:hypothetical protein